MNWWATVYVEAYFSWDTIELAIPNNKPGINSTNFMILKCFYIIKDPAIISKYNKVNEPTFPPLSLSYMIANKIPPVPFQPQWIVHKIPIKVNKIANFK